MPTVSHVMTAKYLNEIKPKYDNGIVYHITVEEDVDRLVKLVTKYARPVDYGIPEIGTAFIRINTTLKKSPNSESWQISGGALTQDDVLKAIEETKRQHLAANPDFVIELSTLTANILNEWDRYSVVFELGITLGTKK